MSDVLGAAAADVFAFAKFLDLAAAAAVFLVVVIVGDLGADVDEDSCFLRAILRAISSSSNCKRSLNASCFSACCRRRCRRVRGDRRRGVDFWRVHDETSWIIGTGSTVGTILFFVFERGILVIL